MHGSNYPLFILVYYKMISLNAYSHSHFHKVYSNQYVLLSFLCLYVRALIRLEFQIAGRL